MLGRAVAIAKAGSWPAAEQRTTVTLDYDQRHRRRIRLTADDGQAFLLDLERASRFEDGDGLQLEDGGYVRVVAAPEPIADLRCAAHLEAARVAWHIGNRHVPLQILEAGVLRIRDDHVIADMARRLGAEVTCGRAPFSPEPGAYATEAGAGHEHAH